MGSSEVTRCKYEHWWRRRLRTGNDQRQALEQGAISLPRPSVPPSLYSKHGNFPSSPSRHPDSDVEKALHIVVRVRSLSIDASNLCLPSFPSHDVLPSAKSVQEHVPDSPKRHIRIVRHLRFTVFTVYRRLFTLVFVLNLVSVVILLHRYPANTLNTTRTINALSALASSNFLVAILIRQDLLVSLLFRTAWLVPWTLSLRVRTIVARVYCYGGIHSGAAIAGSIWWILFTVAMTYTFVQEGIYTLSTTMLSWLIVVFLSTILLLAVPRFRIQYHDTFEMTHRFLGWGSVGLFWCQLLLLAHHVQSVSRYESKLVCLLKNPTFWNLLIITILLVYPWLRLQRWTFTAYPLSSHALCLSFPQKIHRFSCISISSSPLCEWHPFATFPSSDVPDSGASMVISNAGDWTKSVIQDAQMRHTVHNAIANRLSSTQARVNEGVKMRFWVKSHPKAGVLSLSCLFPRVLLVTTGSGIGPCLSSLLDSPQPTPTHPHRTQFARLIWSTRYPHAAYGSHILSLVRKADPNALIIDTNASGRPDLLQVSYKMAMEIKAEAVFVLSNEVVTRALVGGLEKRGIRAFGPIWDS